MLKFIKQLVLFSVMLNMLFLAKDVNANNLPSDGMNVPKDRWIMFFDNQNVTFYLDKESLKLSPDKNQLFYDSKAIFKDSNMYQVYKKIFHINKGYEEYVGQYSVEGDKVEYEDFTKSDPNSIIAYKFRVIANNDIGHKEIIAMQPFLDEQTYKNIINGLIPEYDPVRENSDTKFEDLCWIMFNNYTGINKKSIKKSSDNPKWVDFSVKEQISPKDYRVINLSAEPERNILATIQTYIVKNGKVTNYTDNRITNRIPLTEIKSLEWDLNTDPSIYILCFIKAFRGVKK